MIHIDVVNTVLYLIHALYYKTFYDFIYQLVKDNDPPSCVSSSMYFWTHTEWESDSKASHSKRNSREAREITEVAKTFCEKGGVSPSKITVLCSYRGQVGVCTDVKRCLSCKLVNLITTVTSTSAGNCYHINCNAACSSRSLVYLVECIVSKKQYVINADENLDEAVAQ